RARIVDGVQICGHQIFQSDAGVVADLCRVLHRHRIHNLFPRHCAVVAENVPATVGRLLPEPERHRLHLPLGPSMPSIESSIRPKLKAPAGSCDTHMHIYDGKYPKAATAKFVPPDAPVSAYRKMCARLGIERTVVVQPSTYGKDNRCTLEAVAAMGPNTRCIVVVDESVTDAELDRLTKLGARGIRFFMLPGAPLPWEIL